MLSHITETELKSDTIIISLNRQILNVCKNQLSSGPFLHWPARSVPDCVTNFKKDTLRLGNKKIQVSLDVTLYSWVNSLQRFKVM
jgi:hypothetical protein